jgi:hypothetical protein
MNYNYILYTGAESITGSREFISLRNDTGTFVGDGFIYNPFMVTGAHSSTLSLNRTYININTGDYYVTPDDDTYSSTFRFDQGFTISSSDIVIYDSRSGATGVAYDKGNQQGYQLAEDALTSKVNSIYSNASDREELFNNYNVFFNGQKFQYGFAPSEYQTTGRYFAIPKQANVQETFSGDPDICGTGFVEGQVSYYINGLEASPSNFVETYSGISGFIQSGISSFTPIINQQEDTYNL